jgi:hypothetical protein
LGPGYLFSSILSIKCASTTYMNPFDMLHCIRKILGKWGIVHKGVYFTTKHVKRVVDAHFIDKIEENKYLDSSACAV